MNNILSEKEYQRFIIDKLVAENGYIERKNVKFDRNFAIDREMLFKFLDDTQPEAMAQIRKVYKEYGDRFAIAGIGGVFTPEQAYAKIRSGSSLVMFISSLMYRGPQQITVLKRGLAQLLRRDGFEHVSDAVGVDVE
mgnify:CR=1 FL=1